MTKKGGFFSSRQGGKLWNEDESTPRRVLEGSRLNDDGQERG